MSRSVVRPENSDWKVWQEDDGKYSTESVNRCILLDIRAALNRLVHILDCPNFMDVPKTLRRVAKNTAQPRKRP